MATAAVVPPSVTTTLVSAVNRTTQNNFDASSSPQQMAARGGGTATAAQPLTGDMKAVAGWMAGPDVAPIGISGNARTNYDSPSSTWQTLCSNLIVLTGFAIFAVIVNYVIRSLN